MPIDCDPLSVFDYSRLIAGHDPQPIALTRFGERMLEEARPEGKWRKAMYIPHGIDTGVWRPPDDRKTLREAMGVDDKFVIFMNAANMDKQRKGYAEQFAAFSRFHHRHPDTMMIVHALTDTSQGLKLDELATRMGCRDAVKFNSQYMLMSGMITPEQLRGSYGMADVFSGCSLAEGFGLGPLESMACGVPTIVSDNSAMPEVQGKAGWLVKCEKAWAAGHNAWWGRPLIDQIVKTYETAYAKGPAYHAKKAAAREQAMKYDTDRVLKEHWVPVLEKLEEWACG